MAKKKIKLKKGSKTNELSTNSSEYRQLYESGTLASIDKEGLPNMYYPEVEVVGDAPLKLRKKRQLANAEYTDKEWERYMYQGKKPERDKDFSLLPGDRLNIYNAVLPFEYPNKELPKALKRYITGEERKFLGQESIKEEDRDLGRTDEDAWAHFMGVPQLYNTVNKSEYLPKDSKDKNAEYYSIRKGYPDFDELLLENAHNWFQRKENIDANTLRGVGSPFMPLENVTYSKGQDKKGKYYSMYDIYDFNVPGQKGIGKPYEVYDRVYYDDANSDKPVVLKKSYGGKITNMKKKNKKLQFNNLPKADLGMLVGLGAKLAGAGAKLGAKLAPLLGNLPTGAANGLAGAAGSGGGLEGLGGGGFNGLAGGGLEGLGDMNNQMKNTKSPKSKMSNTFDLGFSPLMNLTSYAVTDMIKSIREPEQEMRPTKRNTGFVMENGGMIKRADGSYSKRGLWDNIRANKGSGKKPTKQMLKQEKKIKQEMAFGGMIDPSMYMQQMMYGSYAQGGEVPQNIPVEVEGGEAYELPNGEMGEFEGPSHDNGGIPVALPEQTKVYSKQLKVNGKTMADRKTKREANVAKLEKILSKNPSDKFIKEALKRQQETASLEEQSDMAMQEQANQQQQMQQQPQQGMMQEQAMAGMMQDPAMMQQMGMMMYGGKLDKLRYGSPGTCPAGQYWNGTECVEIPNSFTSQSKFLNSTDSFKFKNIDSAFQKKDGAWKGITIGKGNQIPHEGFKDYYFNSEGNPFYKFGSSSKYKKDGRNLNFPEQINIAYDDLGVPVTDEKTISELNATLNEPSYLTKNRSEAEYYEGLTAMQPMLQLMNPFINQNKNNYTAPTTTSNPDPYDVMNNLLFGALKNPFAFGAKMGPMPMELKENNPNPNAPKTETTKPNVTDTNPPFFTEEQFNQLTNPQVNPLDTRVKKGGVNVTPEMNVTIKEPVTGQLPTYPLAMGVDPISDMLQQTMMSGIPNPPDPMAGKYPLKKQNKFMNFLNEAADKTGDFFSGLFDKSGKPKKETKKGETKSTGDLPFTAGDRMGMAGTKFGAFAPMATTMLNRMMTPKNQNFFREYGAEGLRAMQEAQGLSTINRDKQLADIKLGEEASRQRGRNSARGVNTLRAMDISSDIAANQAQNQAYNSYAQQMMQMLGQKGQMENQQDQMVMQGETQRDLADRQDVDNFYTNLATNFTSQSELMQKQGRDMNQAQYNKMILEMSPLFSKYGIGVEMRNGKVVMVKDGKTIDETTAQLTAQKIAEEEKKKAGTTTGTAEKKKSIVPAFSLNYRQD